MTSLACMSTSWTPKQLHWLKSATSGTFVHIEGGEPFSVVLLEAIKWNTKMVSLEIHGAANMRCDVSYALAECLYNHPNITRIVFYPRQEYDWENTEEPVQYYHEQQCDYTMLIDAIARSPSLDFIGVCGDLPTKLDEAIIEGLKCKPTFTTLELSVSSLIMKNPTCFGDLLTTGKGLGCLILDSSQCYDVIDTTSLQDGFRKSQSLTTVEFYSTLNTAYFVLESLEANQSVKHLSSMSNVILNPEMVLLVSRLIPRLVSLSVWPFQSSLSALEALCEAVSHSHSMKKFCICHPYGSGVSRMLEQSTSLQELNIAMPVECSEMEELAAGIKACKTLTTLNGHWSWGARGMQAFLDTVIVKQNLTVIGGLRRRECLGLADELLGLQGNASGLCMQVHFYLAFNRAGRSLVGANLSSCLWPHALQKAGGSSLPDALYYFIRETPELVMHHSSIP